MGTKVSAFPVGAAVTDDDLVGMVDDPAGTPTSKKVAASVVKAYVLASPTITGTAAGITKSMVGLGSADNVADASKPVSTAQQAAIDAALLVVHKNQNMTATTVEAFNRLNINGSGQVASGTVRFSYFTPLINLTVSKIGFRSGFGGSSGLTLARLGLYTVSGTTLTLVARTASDTTLFNTTYTYYERALDTTGGYPASYALVAGTRYILAQIQVGTTPAYSLFAYNDVLGQAGDGNTPISATLTAQTDLPVSTSAQVVAQYSVWGILVA